MGRVGRHLRGNVVAYVAVFVALGGTAFAIERNSVKGKHIAPSAVGSSDIAPSAVGSSDIAPDAVASSDIRDGTIGAIDMDAWPVIAFDEPTPCNTNGGVPSNDETRISWPEPSIQTPGLAGSSDCQGGSVGVQVSRPPFEDGIYLVTLNLVWDENATGTRQLHMYSSFGGAFFGEGTEIANSSVQPNASGRTGQTLSKVIQLAENEEVFATAYQTSGEDMTLDQGSFSVAWLSAPPS